jgi:hypothetical protein
MHSVTSNAGANALNNINEFLIPRNRLTNLNNVISLNETNKIVLYSTSFQPSNAPSSYSNYWWGFVYNHPEIDYLIIQVVYTYHFQHCYTRSYDTTTQVFGNWVTVY